MTDQPQTTAKEDEIVFRRLGSDHGKPCRHGASTCAIWACQEANECRWNVVLGCQLDIHGETHISRDLGRRVDEAMARGTHFRAQASKALADRDGLLELLNA